MQVGWADRQTWQIVLAIALVGVLATGLLVTLFPPHYGPPLYGYTVHNYSSSQYVVRVIYENGNGGNLAVPPRAAVNAVETESAPKQAVVYDAACVRKLASLALSEELTDIYIDEGGAISTASPKEVFRGPDLPVSGPGTAPATCP
jgi:hypothetical protein